MSELVTVGVPVYRGEAYLEEALRCVQAQTHDHLEVIMSVDGPDPACEAICARLLDDPRFRLVVQPRNLGWVGNINWLMAQAQGEYWYFHQQDDLTAPAYVATLLAHARANPQAALVCCDMIPIGRIQGRFQQPPQVLGETPVGRQFAMLREQIHAFAFRGLARMEAVRGAGAIPENNCENFGVDIVWLASIALNGELHRLPLELYWKRYHDRNTESRWWEYGRARRLEAWACHCVDMVEQALRAECTVEEARLLWLAGVERLTSRATAGTYLPVDDLTDEEDAGLLEEFLGRARTAFFHDIPYLLDSAWDEIEGLSRAFHLRPDGGTCEILAFGPDAVGAGLPFNLQPDGSSALYVQPSRRLPRGARLAIDGQLMQTYISGRYASCVVPPEATARPSRLEVKIVARDGTQLSPPVTLRVVEPGWDPSMDEAGADTAPGAAPPP